MAGLNLTLQSSEHSTGTSKKTVLQLVAPANQRLLVRGFWLDGKSTTNTDPPMLCEIERQSSAGTGGDAVTPKKKDPGADETIQSSGQENIDGSTQPTAGDVVMRRLIHPQGGLDFYHAFHSPVVVPGGGRLGIAITTATAQNIVAGFDYEE